MIKCEVIKDFTLSKFNELENVVKKTVRNENEFGVGDTFECNKEMADYLTGNNPANEVVIRIIEVIPEKITEPLETKIEFSKEKTKPKATIRKTTAKKTKTTKKNK